MEVQWSKVTLFALIRSLSLSPHQKYSSNCMCLLRRCSINYAALPLRKSPIHRRFPAFIPLIPEKASRPVSLSLSLSLFFPESPIAGCHCAVHIAKWWKWKVSFSLSLFLSQYVLQYSESCVFHFSKMESLRKSKTWVSFRRWFSIAYFNQTGHSVQFHVTNNIQFWKVLTKERDEAAREPWSHAIALRNTFPTSKVSLEKRTRFI